MDTNTFHNIMEIGIKDNQSRKLKLFVRWSKTTDATKRLLFLIAPLGRNVLFLISIKTLSSTQNAIKYNE